MGKVERTRPGYWRERALTAEGRLAAVCWGLLIGLVGVIILYIIYGR